MSALQDTYLDIVNNVDEGVQAAVQAQQTLGIYITTSASTRNQLVGISSAIEGIDQISNDNDRREYNRTLGSSMQIDAYIAILASIEVGLGMVVDAVYATALLPRAHSQTIYVFTNNRTI